MTGIAIAARPSIETDADAHAYDPVLRWMILTGVSLFTAVALWRYGFIHLMVASDRTYISSAIAVLYVAGSLHALARAIKLSRETVSAIRARSSGHLITAHGVVGDYLRDLVAKARARGLGELHQELLLRVLAERLREGAALGALASDTLMKLGLLGTIIGFILMLGPVASLNAEDQEALRSAMGVMSDGMSVAMYTTLAGLVGSLLIRAQHFMIDAATATLFWDVVRWTETKVAPALERADV